MNLAEQLFWRYAGIAIYLFHLLSLAVAYLAGLYWLYYRDNKMKPFANLGRMALTNYLSQSMIMIPACLIFGLFDQFTPLKTLAWSAGIWMTQVLFCTWWLKQYHFGPVEWLLRSFTYWRWQPLKRKMYFQSTEAILPT